MELIQQTKGDIGINKEFGDFLGDICNLKQQKRRCGATGPKPLDIWEQQLVNYRNLGLAPKFSTAKIFSPKWVGEHPAHSLFMSILFIFDVQWRSFDDRDPFLKRYFYPCYS